MLSRQIVESTGQSCFSSCAGEALVHIYFISNRRRQAALFDYMLTVLYLHIAKPVFAILLKREVIQKQLSMGFSSKIILNLLL